jgi:UDP-2-acetamido-3-amino-2,3-dideoxy-glucuronate N-acetyltransferase
MGKAVIGENCNIGQNVFIANHVIIGNNCKIQNNVSLYEGLIVEDDVFIGPSAVFTNIKNPRSFINRRDQYTPTVIRRGVTIGANSTIICGVEIGKYSLIGAGAVVTKNVPQFTKVVGNPAVIVGPVTKDAEECS